MDTYKKKGNRFVKLPPQRNVRIGTFAGHTILAVRRKRPFLFARFLERFTVDRRSIIWLFMLSLAMAVTFHYIALWTTYQLVFVQHVAIEFNQNNIPIWASFGFWPGSLLETLATALVPVYLPIAVLIILMPRLQRKLRNRPVLAFIYSMADITLVVTLLVMPLATGLDAAMDGTYYLAVNYFHQHAYVDYSALTGCYYYNSTAGTTIWLNQSYAGKSTLDLNLAKCLPIPG